jgi:hypothetical protein
MTSTQASFFGLSANSIANQPTVPFSGTRLWDTGTTWKDLETARGTYNWAPLDAWLAQAKNGGKDVLYTFGKVPTWAGGGASFAAPPSDIASGDTQWKEFVTAIVTHSLLSQTAKITAYEMWNEPDLAQTWTGTAAQLVTMISDAYAIIRSLDPNAVIVGPSPSTSNQFGVHFLPNYYAAGGAAFQDVVACHGYTYDSSGPNSGKASPTPAGLVASIASLKTLMQANNIGNLPIWYTEGNWQPFQDALLSDDGKVSYLAQYYIFLWANGVARAHWYAWDNTKGFGELWNSSTGITPAGNAYANLYAWLVGATQTSLLAQDANGTWTVSLTLAGGVPAQLVWNPTSRSFPTNFHTFSNLNDATPRTVTGGTVTIGNKPILLQ